MIRHHRAHMAACERRSGSPNHSPHGAVDYLAAGIVHVLNGPREARQEVERGHLLKGIVHGATSAADLEFGRSVVNGVRRGAFKISGPHDWKSVRKWMGEKGLAAEREHVHHWAIPQNGWGKAVPDWIKNQPWNGRPMETTLDHIRTHSRSLKFDLPRFNALERYWNSTPRWWKAANASAAGHAVELTDRPKQGQDASPQGSRRHSR